MSLINLNKILGIVTEYNPFHNGHLHHLIASKEKTKSDAVVAVMSGHFTQRGEPAIADPHTRAKWAIESGVDLVLALPVHFSTASAAYFAHGSVYMLDALKCVDTLCFGSESGNIHDLQSIEELIQRSSINADCMNVTSESYSRLREQLLIGSGLSAEHLTKANNILGIAYLEALRRIESPIQPETIQRITAGYHDLQIEDSIASATAIRNALTKQDTQIQRTIPPSTCEDISELIRNADMMAKWQDYCHFTLRMKSLESLYTIHDMADGMAERMKSAALSSKDFDEMFGKMRTKAYTDGRFKRVMAKMMLDIRKEDLKNDCMTNPEYIHILGFNETGRHILNKIKTDIPLITNPKHFRPENTTAMRQWEADLLASKLYSMLYRHEDYRRVGVFSRRSPIYIKK